MATAGDELAELRLEAQKRHRAATNKISRLKSRAGVQISGTRNDPRRPRGNIRRYNKTQLRAYIRELNSFTDRRVQFVSDTRGKPMPASDWARYKQLEQRYKARVESRVEQVANIPLPNTDMNIGQRLAATRADHPQIADAAVNVPYRPADRRPQNVASARALERLTRAMEQRLKPRYFNRLVSEGRRQFEILADNMNLSRKIVDKVRNLPNERFDLLWHYTGFADALSLGYQATQSMLADKESSWYMQEIETAVSDAESLVDWAGSVDMGS